MSWPSITAEFLFSYMNNYTEVMHDATRWFQAIGPGRRYREVTPLRGVSWDAVTEQ
jgi:hypothetical protein